MNTPNHAFRIFFISLLIFAFSGSGYIDSTDAEPSLDLAKAILQTGSFRVSPGVKDTYFQFRDAQTGRGDRYFYFHGKTGWYSKLGLTLLLLYLPAVAAGKVADLCGLSSELTLRFLSSFVNAILSSPIVTLVFRFFRRGEHTLSESVLIASAVGFATFVFLMQRWRTENPFRLCVYWAPLCSCKGLSQTLVWFRSLRRLRF